MQVLLSSQWKLTLVTQVREKQHRSSFVAPNGDNEKNECKIVALTEPDDINMNEAIPENGATRWPENSWYEIAISPQKIFYDHEGNLRWNGKNWH